MTDGRKIQVGSDLAAVDLHIEDYEGALKRHCSGC